MVENSFLPLLAHHDRLSEKSKKVDDGEMLSMLVLLSI